MRYFDGASNYGGSLATASMWPVLHELNSLNARSQNSALKLTKRILEGECPRSAILIYVRFAA